MASRATDRIRQQMEQRDGITAEAMEPLAQAYTTEVTLVNERLDECLQLLRKGLRSEAIQRANIKPNLLDWSASLDFPESEEWFEILQFLGISPPPPLNRQAAQQLQEAIVEEQPLDELLRQHRRLAIAKAPLSWRLKVLQRIQSLDSINTAWIDDLSTWQAARIQQLPGEATQAKQSRDLDHAKRLKEEVSNGTWHVELPKNVLKQVVSTYDDLLLENQVAELEECAHRLEAAFAEQNITDARQERDHWLSAINELQRPLNPELMERIEPALVWIAEIDKEEQTQLQHDRASQNLQILLDRNAKRTELERAFHAILKLDRGIDDLLLNRYQVRIHEIALASRRRTAFAFISLFAATLLLGGSVFAWQWQSSHKRMVDTTARELKSLLEGANISAAEDLWKRIETQSPSLMKAPELTSLVSQLQELKDKENKREAEFERYLQKASADDPSKIDMDALLQADKLSVTDPEKASVQRIRQQRSAWESNLQQEHLQSVREGIRLITEELDAIERLPVDSRSSSRCDAILDKITNLGSLQGAVHPQAKDLLELAKRRTNGIRDAARQTLESKLKIRQGLDTLRSAGTLQAYVQNLQLFVQNLPDEHQSKDFVEVLKEQTRWESIALWNEWTSNVDLMLSKGIGPEQATEILEGLVALNNRVQCDELVASIHKNIREELERVQKRTEIVEKLAEDLEELVVRELVTVEGILDDPNGQKVRGFVPEASSVKLIESQKKLETSGKLKDSTKLGTDIVIDGAGAVENKTFLGKVTFHPDPQQLVYELTQRINHSRLLIEWDAEMISILGTIYVRKNLDNSIKEMLLSKLVQNAMHGSSYLSEKLSAANGLLAQRSVNRKNWFELRPLDSRIDASIADKLLADFKAANIQKETSRDGLRRLSRARLEWVGSMQREEDGIIRLWVTASERRSGKLYALVPAIDKPDVTLIAEIGEIASGQTKITGSSADFLPGRPLFLLPDVLQQNR